MADQRLDPDATFEEARRSLYRERPEDFVATRDSLVRELRGRKERDLAARVARLRRPPLALWLANRLHEVAGPQLRDLLAAGGELQAAQASAAAGDASARRRFRELIARHSQLIDGLVRAGLALSEEQGHGSGEEVGRRLAATLRAASTEPGESGQALLEGRLDAEMEPGGFALVSSPGAGAGFGMPSPPAAPGPAAGEEEPESALEVAARAAEARRAAVESERAAMAARSRAEELSHRADALAREARKAREEADAADAKARSAEEAAAEAQRAARELERPRRT